MNITDIHGNCIKVGKTSITVKGDSEKTKGVVTNCKAFSAMSPADKFLLHKKNIPTDGCKNCVIQNGNIYYLHDTFLENWISRQKHPETFTSEYNKAKQLKNTAEAMRNNGITVIECVIEK